MVILPFTLDVSILSELTELLRLKAPVNLVVSRPFAEGAKGWGTETCAWFTAQKFDLEAG
jgi:hypothetical protein